MTPFERWQMEKYSNIIPEQQDKSEEYETRQNIETIEACEWLEEELIHNNSEQ